MWNALKEAAVKLGDEVAGALDSMTDADLPSFMGDSQEEENSKKVPAQKEQSTEKQEKEEATSSSKGNPQQQESSESNDRDEFVVAAENVSKWFYSATEEVSKIVMKMETAVERGVDAFNDFVEAKKSEARRDGAENTLLNIATEVDDIEAQLQSIKNKEGCKSEWEPLEESLLMQAAALNSLVKSEETSEEMKQLAERQIARVERLLGEGDMLKCKTTTPADVAASASSASASSPSRSAPSPAVEETKSTAEEKPQPTPPEAPKEEEKKEEIKEVLEEKPTGPTNVPDKSPSPPSPKVAKDSSSESEEELAQSAAAAAQPELRSSSESQSMCHIDPMSQVVPATPTPTHELTAAAEETESSPCPSEELVHVNPPPATNTDHPFEWDDKW